MVIGRLFGKIRKGLAKTAGVFTGVFDLLRGKGRVDQAFLDALERQLYLADVGTQATAVIVDRVRQAFRDKEISGEVLEFVKAQLRELLSGPSEGITYAPGGPTVVMIAGVNGAGKTTSIAKVAKRLQSEGKKVAVAACDTFRAAAVEQLTVWAGRIGCDIIKQKQDADPASVAHDACEAAKARKYDVLIVDTAGRLHTQTHLMREVEKIHKVVSRQIDGAPREVVIVVADERRHVGE